MNQRERNRRDFPVMTALVDRLREAGLEPRVMHVCEGGREVGRDPVKHRPLLHDATDPRDWQALNAMMRTNNPRRKRK